MSALFIAIVFRHLKEKVAQKAALFESIFIAQEEERGRIAMDLHDDLGSLLISLKLNFEDMLQSNDLAYLKTGIGSSVTSILEAIQLTRLTSHTLMPETLKKYGLKSAINDLIHRLNKSLDIRFVDNYECRLPQILEINIYRIICELLTNSIKHSNATIVKISISKINNQIWVNYSDNGSGFDYFDALNNSSGIGISNIRNRVEFLKGNIQYRNHDGSNFLISFNQ
jgi:signal transduction histidine kinase